MGQPDSSKRNQLGRAWRRLRQRIAAARFLGRMKAGGWQGAALLVLALHAPARADKPCSGGDSDVARPIAATLQSNISAIDPNGRFDAKIQSNDDLTTNLYLRHSVGGKELFRVVRRLQADLSSVVLRRLPASEGVGFSLQAEDGGSGLRNFCTYGFRFENGAVFYRTLAVLTRTREGGVFPGDATPWQPVSQPGVNLGSVISSHDTPAKQGAQVLAQNAAGEFPPMPFIDQGYQVDVLTGEWQLRRLHTLFADIGDKPRAMGTLNSGETVVADQIAIRTLHYELYEVSKPTTEKFWNLVPKQGDLKTIATKVALKKGDRIFVLSYFGEGECRVWFKGKTYVAECPPTPDVEDGKAAKLESEVWARVVTPKGVRGYLRNPDALGMSKHD